MVMTFYTEVEFEVPLRDRIPGSIFVVELLLRHLLINKIDLQIVSVCEIRHIQADSTVLA